MTTTPEDDAALGLIDGAVPASTRRFTVVLDEGATVELDALVVTTQTLPDGSSLAHYGIVQEASGHIEGAELPSDTLRITGTRTMPGVTSRRVEVQVLRTVPERWLAPAPGARVSRATGAHREQALFLDQMKSPLAIGLDASGAPVYADFAFMSGEKGGHVSISGVSGVATKTTYAAFLLYMLLETDEGRRLLGAHGPSTRALVFNVKGEDLLHLDRPNAQLDAHPNAREEWRRLGVDAPGPFTDVRLYAPRSAAAPEGGSGTDVVSRPASALRAYGWTPEDFIREGLLELCFTEEEDAGTQVSFVVQRVRTQLLRWAGRLRRDPGAIVLAPPAEGTSQVFERLARRAPPERDGADGVVIRDFPDLVEFLTEKLTPDTPGHDREWTGGVAAGTCMAFLRRLYAQQPRLGHLIACGLTPVRLESRLTVVDIHGLHDAAQRFVVGALLRREFEAKQGQGREPLRFVVLDELNKYAPRSGRSPIKDALVDISARGRSLGVLLIGAQQSAAEVDGNVIRNAAVKVAGRLDAGEAAEYRFLTAELRERAARFLPGTMVFDQPLVPAPIPIRFPFPGFATCVAEGEASAAERAAAEDAVFGRLL